MHLRAQSVSSQIVRILSPFLIFALSASLLEFLDKSDCAFPACAGLVRDLNQDRVKSRTQAPLRKRQATPRF